MRRLGAGLLCAAALAGPAAAQANLQSAGVPQAPVDPVDPAAAASTSGPPAPLSAPEPVYLRRDGVACSDFKRVEGGGWSALNPVQFPGPAGPVQLVAGQTLGPGDYVSGLNLAAVLQRQCPDAPGP